MNNQSLVRTPYQKTVKSGPGRIRTCDQAIIAFISVRRVFCFYGNIILTRSIISLKDGLNMYRKKHIGVVHPAIVRII